MKIDENKQIISRIKTEKQDDLLIAGGFRVIFGTNTCYFNGLRFDRETALCLVLGLI